MKNAVPMSSNPSNIELVSILKPIINSDLLVHKSTQLLPQTHHSIGQNILRFFFEFPQQLFLELTPQFCHALDLPTN